MNQFPPSTISIPLETFELFRKFRGILSSLTPVAIRKNLQSEKLTYRYIFFFKFTLKCKQSNIVPIICNRCCWHLLQIYRQCRWYQWQFATGHVDTGGKFATSINDTSSAGGKFTTGGKFISSLVDAVGATWLAYIS